ncbi:hypothetical protein QTH25_13715 [Clostridium perfringens]|uniref:hypothetical protein n=1 Tax=Clostridium perfringens TaxID=1502 RepID=UPI00338E4254|nr:hypothetical protein [Clostridium perfringens]
MSLRGFNIKDFEENEFYHLVKEENFDKSRVYFIKDDTLFELEMMGEPKESNHTYNFINKSSFVKANVSVNMEQLPRWTKVDALIDGEWVKRYFYSYKENVEEVAEPLLIKFKTDIEILVTPCSEEMFDSKFIERANGVRLDEKDRYKTLTWVY